MKHERILNIVLATMLLAMMFVLSWHEKCLLGERSDGTPAVELRIDTVWVRDTILTTSPVVVREEVREVPASVDTAAIVQHYFTARVLSDTFHLRDMVTVRITDTLFQNDIVGRTVDYDLATLEPTVIYTPAAGQRHPRVALSAGVQLGREQVAVLAGLRIRRAELLGGYDLRLRAASVSLKYDVWQWQ